MASVAKTCHFLLAVLTLVTCFLITSFGFYCLISGNNELLDLSDFMALALIGVSAFFANLVQAHNTLAAQTTEEGASVDRSLSYLQASIVMLLQALALEQEIDKSLVVRNSLQSFSECAILLSIYLCGESKKKILICFAIFAIFASVVLLSTVDARFSILKYATALSIMIGVVGLVSQIYKSWGGVGNLTILQPLSAVCVNYVGLLHCFVLHIEQSEKQLYLFGAFVAIYGPICLVWLGVCIIRASTKSKNKGG